MIEVLRYGTSAHVLALLPCGDMLIRCELLRSVPLRIPLSAVEMMRRYEYGIIVWGEVFIFFMDTLIQLDPLLSARTGVLLQAEAMIKPFVYGTRVRVIA